MRLLLDTNAFLYTIIDSPAMSRRVRSLVESLEHDLLLSMASVWEMAIKVSIGKLTLSQPLDRLIASQLALARITLLPIAVSDTWA